MKKLMMTLAAGLSATALIAVTSDNIVGYNTVTITNGYNLLACNFDGVAGDDGMSLDELVPGTTAGLTKGATSPSSDNIMIFNPATKGYTTYFLWYSTKTSTANNNKWVLNSTTLANARLNSGDPFWYNARTNQPIQVPATFIGQVPAESQKSFSITNGYNMLSCLFAADWDPNDLGTAFWQAAPAKKGATSPSADNIMVFNPVTKGYTTYFLWYSTKTSTANNYKWVLNSTTVAPADFVKVGQGVWYNFRETVPAGFEVPVDRPYTME